MAKNNKTDKVDNTMKENTNKNSSKAIDTLPTKSSSSAVVKTPKRVVGNRIVRIVPNPNKRSRIKLKKGETRFNSAGTPIINSEGVAQKTLVDADSIQLPGTTRTIKPSVSKKTGMLSTGLDVMIDNPYKDEDVYYPAEFEKILKGRPKILLQHALEYKHKKRPHYYTNSLIDRIEPSDKHSELPFFMTQASQIHLDGGVNFLNLSNPIHEVHLYTLLASPEVANDFNQLDDNPEALYYLEDSSEVISIRSQKKRRENIAIAALEEVYNSGGDMIIKWSKCLENPFDGINRDSAYNWLDSFFRKGEVEYAQFMKYYDMFKDPARRSVFLASSALQEYIDKSVIRKRDNKYYWIMPETDSTIQSTFEWNTKDSIINDFLLAPEYAKEVSILESIYQSRKNM